MTSPFPSQKQTDKGNGSSASGHLPWGPFPSSTRPRTSVLSLQRPSFTDWRPFLSKNNLITAEQQGPLSLTTCRGYILQPSQLFRICRGAPAPLEPTIPHLSHQRYFLFLLFKMSLKLDPPPRSTGLTVNPSPSHSLAALLAGSGPSGSWGVHFALSPMLTSP